MADSRPRRRSDGRPLAVKVWPYRTEFDSVLASGLELGQAAERPGLRHRASLASCSAEWPRIGPQPAVDALGPGASTLSARCRAEAPDAWATFHRELTRFEALHGEWRGDTDSAWEILRRTYVAAIGVSLSGGAGARAVQIDSGIVGAERFHALSEPSTGREDTALLAYLFGCAHPHFLWNCMGYRPAAVRRDWLDG